MTYHPFTVTQYLISHTSAHLLLKQDIIHLMQMQRQSMQAITNTYVDAWRACMASMAFALDVQVRGVRCITSSTRVLITWADACCL